MTNRQVAARETKRKIVETAKILICEKGLANTSVDEITQKSGVSKGSFYTYFKRKEEIVFELSLGMFNEILEHAKNYEGNFFEKLKFYMIEFAGYIENSSVKLCQEWVKNVIVPEMISENYDKNKIKLDIENAEKLLKYGIECGELKRDCPINYLAKILNDILYGEMLCWAMCNGEYSYKERTKEFCEKTLKDIFEKYLI